MFLSKLSPLQKDSFIKLAYLVANVDGDFSDSERIVFNQYLEEMDMESTPDFSQFKDSIGSLVEAFSDRVSQRIVFMEILALIHSDYNYSSTEQKVVSELTKIFSFSDSEVNVLSNWARMAVSVVNQGVALLDS